MDEEHKKLLTEVNAAIEKMNDSVAAASRTKLWNFDTAQALIPGRDALFSVQQKVRKQLGLSYIEGI